MLIKLVGAGTLFLAQLIAARVLGATMFGYYTFAIVITTYLAVPGKLGYDLASLRLAGSYHSNAQYGLLRGYLRSSSVAVVLISTGIAITYLTAVTILRARIDPQLFPLLALSAVLVPLTSLGLVLEADLRACKRVVMAFLPQSIFRPVALVACLGLGYAALRTRIPASLVVGMNAVSAAIALAIAIVLLRKACGEALKGAAPEYRHREWLSLALSMTAVNVFSILIDQSDSFFVGILVSPGSVGIYSVAARISTLIAFGLAAANAIVAPLISTMHAAGELARLGRLLRTSAQAVLLFTVIATVAIVMFGSSVLSMFGPAFVTGYRPLIVLMIGQLVNAWAGPVALLLTLTGHQHSVTKVLAVTAVAAIVLNVILIPRLGVMGAATAKTVLLIGWNGALALIAFRRLGIRGTAF